MPSRQRLFSFTNVNAMRPITGLILRAAIDVGSIWAAFLVAGVVAGLFADGSDVTAVVDRAPLSSVLWAASFSLLVLIAYATAGLYTCANRYTLWTKIDRLVRVNLVLLAIVSAMVALLGGPLSTSLLMTTFVGSTGLVCLARLLSQAVRLDYRGESADERHEQADENDENKVLVIGGAGYVGSALVEKLLNLNKLVTVLDAMHFGEEALARVAGHPNLTLIREDFRHIEVLTRAMNGSGAVIHLGGLVGDPACALDPDLTIDINVTSTKLVGEIAKARGVRRFIFASSCSVYGACDEIVDETSQLNPQSLYARSKVASEIVLGALNGPDFSVTCLRFATIYGLSGRTRFDLVVNLLCAKAVREGAITVFGADQWRPFVHVDDVAKAIVMTLQAPVDVVAGEAFSVGSDDQNYTLGEVAQLINRQVSDATIVIDDTCVDRRNYRVCFKKIRALLGFEPAWTLERGIAQVVAMVRTNEVGHYSLPTYSNVLYLKARGTQSFGFFKITGWEDALMNTSQIASSETVGKSVAA
jgi:nucleoside-diphosphate-sugar epimerase